MNRSAHARDDASVAGLPARAAALRLLDAVLRQGQRLDVAATYATRGIADHADRALAVAIATEVLRHLTDLDALIDSATAQAIPEDAKARMVLRMALVQALKLGTPQHAAVATALPLMAGGPRRLVHGVLGGLFRRGVSLPAPPLLPPQIEERWQRAWGPEMVGDAARALADAPPLDLRLKHGGADSELGGESLYPGHVRLGRGQDVTSLPGFADGRFWVQNLAAQLPVALLGKGNGRTVLDLCAAPGGKTMQLAAAGWRVTAVESNARRIATLSDNLTRTRLEAELVEGDVLRWEPADEVDALLLDAPCTATGIFGRHPDVLYRIGDADIAALATRQGEMLDRASRWLKPGGRLIYAVCSLEPEEGEQVVAGAALSIDPIGQGELPAGLSPSAEGWLRILPKPGLDGFFIARLKHG